MAPTPVSVLTLVAGRRTQLRNLMRGLAQSAQPPGELVIAAMDELRADELPPVGYPVAILPVRRRGAHRLPLAEARNAAARAARYEQLVFLDADCIPGADLLTVLAKACQQTNGAVMGEVRYLPEGLPGPDFAVADLHAPSVPHPNRPRLESGEIRVSPAYHLLWTLCVAVTKQRFGAVGGFDEAYTGYGAEDTDFAFALERAGVPFHLAGAYAYHQYHPVYRPPVTLARDIAANSQVFYGKWGRWPMEGWLGQLSELGLLDWQPSADRISFLREPTGAEIAVARQDDGKGF